MGPTASVLRHGAAAQRILRITIHMPAARTVIQRSSIKNPNPGSSSPSHFKAIPMAGTASSIDKHSRSILGMKEAQIANNIEDLISNLSDDVLRHILSFIPTKNAVATSVLSNRWKLLWTSVPNLDFGSSRECHSTNHTNFMNFVDKVLSLNNVSPVRRVRLRCECDCNDEPLRVKVHAWTSAIAWRDTEYFDLKLPVRYCIQNLDQISRIISLPDSFFSRQNHLVELKLKRIGLKVPTSVNFPSLKTIRFDRIQLLGDDSMKNLLSGCPILKSLDIHRSEWDNAQTLYICSASLGDLLLHTMACTKKDFGYKVVIDAPNLSRLTLTDRVDVNYDLIMNDLSSLKEVYLSVEPDGVVRDEMFYVERLFDLFTNISHVENLCLSARTMRYLGSAYVIHLPMFNNLTHLKVELLPKNCCPFLPILLHCSPNIVNLFLVQDYRQPDIEWYKPYDVPKCLLSNLEEIQIKLVEGNDGVMKMILYFLKNAMVMKKMDVTSFDLDLKRETNIRKHLLKFPRSPSNCQVEYYNQRLSRDELL